MTDKKRKIEKTELPNLQPLLSANPELLNSSENKDGKKRIILRAPVLTQSGYGVHSRQVARWLFDQYDNRDDLEVYVEPLKWGVTPWIVDTDAYDGLIGRIVQHSTNAEHYDVSLQLQLPNEWNPFLADYNIGITAAVETDKCNPKWIDNVNQMDMVIVPSEFIKSVLENSGEVKTKLVVVPEAFTDSCKDDNDNSKLESIKELDNIKTDFNFLIFGQITGNNPDNDRKNLAYTIKWLSEEFKNNEDVGVVVKTNLGRNTKLDQLNTVNILTKILLETKKGPGPKFYLLHGSMDEGEISSLYRHEKIKALVSFTRGEGFGLPILEAAACGLPTIVTNWSAHTEFLKQGKFIKVDYKLGPIHESRVDNAIFLPEMRWAHPDESDAKRKLRKFYRSPEIPTQWAKDLAKILQETHNFESISSKYTKLFEKIL